MKQTAVEFIVQRLEENGILHSFDICEAKEMEKQQMKNAYKKCILSNDIKLFNDYYNETFNKEV